MNALTPLGMVSELPSENQTNDLRPELPVDESKDYFVERDGMKFAGMHLLVDLWDASHLNDPDYIDAALRKRPGRRAKIRTIGASFCLHWGGLFTKFRGLGRRGRTQSA